MTVECTEDVRLIMEKEIVKSGELLFILNANLDFLPLDAVSVDLPHQIARLWE